MSDGAIPIQSKIKRVTIQVLNKMKKNGEVIAALSIYDAQHARLFDEAGGDMIVVGDSAGMTVFGRRSPLSVTMEEMIMLTNAVKRGTDRLFVIGDMPLASYEVSNEDAVRNALRFIKETECNAVKTEVTLDYVDRIKAIANACLVVAHIGLNPNKAEMLGGYRTQGKTKESYGKLAQTIIAVEQAGACMILIESVAEPITQKLQSLVDVPVIAIAAGRNMAGQLLISSDLLGLYPWPGTPPVHFTQYRTDRDGATVGEATLDAFRWYVTSVKNKTFPGSEHVHHLKPEEVKEVLNPNNDEESFQPAIDMS